MHYFMVRVAVYRMKILLFASVLLMLSSSLLAQEKADAITGVWLDETEEGYIQIYSAKNESGKTRYFGKIVGAPKDPNSEPSESDKDLVGKRIIEGLRYDDGSWKGGSIYAPDNGKTYQCKMSLEGMDKLKIRGYIGISLIGRTTTWTRNSRTAPGVVQDVLE